ncbi:hypothetical protein NZK35_01960 [Stieleria sp. ICT_E10.1]|uniref:4Fe-4S binding protein n=1 Tax=Stieleria sedimenti TaxID=2976331 RepID=UPI00217F872F|nr:hypothetical protein [Stieleria sedimenti]MCS7465432.1 hypothetical protein [Stieleria sedimenti]
MSDQRSTNSLSPALSVSNARSGRRRQGFDLLSLPLLGRFLRWHRSRLVLQIPVLLISLLMIAHAFFGPQLAPKNLAALLTWVHFRGLVVLVILFAGNFFCMACPFMLPRELARKLHAPRLRWPKAMSSKWPAIALFVLVLFLYEWCDLFSSPWWTGVLIVMYMISALVIDALFQRASFCKFVCPIGQFNFLSSTLSPLEVTVRDRGVCDRCETKDCIRGRSSATSSNADSAAFEPSTLSSSLPVVQRGCELALFQPRKVGNLDCTFCLDCVYACPEDNVGIFSRMPGEELCMTGPRSGLGMPERRGDFSALAIVFTFGALLNAFAMISPVYALEASIAKATGLTVEWPILGTIFVLFLVVEPAVLLLGAAAVTRRMANTAESLPTIVQRYAPSLLPIGFGVWLAHYAFHFLTGVLTVIPVTQHAVRQATGADWLGHPQWQLGGLPESVVYAIEIGFLALGLLGSLIVASAIGRRAPNTGTETRTSWITAPWAVLHVALFLSAVWIMNQPMDMRGTFLGG